jgi:hypothetical protein
MLTLALAYSRNKDSGVEGFPLRSWSIEVYLLNEHGEQVPANVFDKVTYTLHPSFGDRAVQSTSLPLPLCYQIPVMSRGKGTLDESRLTRNRVKQQRSRTLHSESRRKDGANSTYRLA